MESVAIRKIQRPAFSRYEIDPVGRLRLPITRERF